MDISGVYAIGLPPFVYLVIPLPQKVRGGCAAISFERSVFPSIMHREPVAIFWVEI